MARKPRTEFPGAIYHVVNRGNYRKAVFQEPGSGEAFERALFEAAESSNWWLHAYTIMPNHYHAVIETPDDNLSAGMHWLQGTFASRFNRLHDERGHVFQGRFKSPLIEPGEVLRRVVDYVHLNPVRAGICPLERLRGYALSSYGKFWLEGRSERLVRSRFLDALGVPDSLDGMRAYEEWLAARKEADPEKEEQFRIALQKAWVLGSKEFRESIQERFDQMEPAEDWGGAELNEFLEGQWERIVRGEMRERGLREEDRLSAPKLAGWKIEISRRLRKETRASNGWIARRLNMGHPSNVSKYLKRDPKSKG
jgi:REP element-mobilizing transposase RayT